MLPLFARFPALATLPRAELTTLPSPVQCLALPGGRELWVKRDDLNSPEHGGNKVRALEFLLGAVRSGDTVLTIGGEGSTHVLATAAHATRLGAHTTARRWPHECSPTAHAVAREAERLCDHVLPSRNAVVAVVRLAAARLRDRVAGALHDALSSDASARRGGDGRRHVVPVGGSEPFGVLGHVNAALELADQIAAGALPAPRRVVLPLGSAGTAAGLALGFAIAGLPTDVVAVRVVPRIAAPRRRVLRLADATARLIERVSARAGVTADVPRVEPTRVRVEHAFYGGAYGRTLPAGDRAAALLHDAGARDGALPPLTLDPTYSAKAAAAALAIAAREPGPTLLWATFDGRWMESGLGYRLSGIDVPRDASRDVPSGRSRYPIPDTRDPT